MVKKRKKASSTESRQVKPVQLAQVSVQPKPAIRVQVKPGQKQDILSEKDREILSEVDKVIWNPSLLNKLNESGKMQVPDGHEKNKKLAK
jgi:hypothetical protein